MLNVMLHACFNAHAKKNARAAATYTFALLVLFCSVLLLHAVYARPLLLLLSYMRCFSFHFFSHLISFSRVSNARATKSRARPLSYNVRGCCVCNVCIVIQLQYDCIYIISVRTFCLNTYCNCERSPKTSVVQVVRYNNDDDDVESEDRRSTAHGTSTEDIA